MGGQGSTQRKLVIEDVEGGTVKITEAVARRLQGLPDVEEGKQASAAPPQNQKQPQQSQDPSSQGENGTSYPNNINPEVEDFYVQKLKELQEIRNAELQKQTKNQFAKAVKEVEDKFIDYTASPVCQDLQCKVLECYQANGKQTLNCSAIVNSFTACVDRARMAASTTRTLQPVS